MKGLEWSYFKGFSVDALRGEFVLLQVDPFQVGDAIEGSRRDAADVIPCRSEKCQLPRGPSSFSVSAVFILFASCTSKS